MKTNHNAKTSARRRDKDSLVPCSLLQRNAASGNWNGTFSLNKHHSLRCDCITSRFTQRKHNAQGTGKKKRSLRLCLRQAHFHGEISTFVLASVVKTRLKFLYVNSYREGAQKEFSSWKKSLNIVVTTCKKKNSLASNTGLT